MWTGILSFTAVMLFALSQLTCLDPTLLVQ